MPERRQPSGRTPDVAGPTGVTAKARYHKNGWYDVPEWTEITYTDADGVVTTCGQGLPGDTRFVGEKGTIFVTRGKLTTDPSEILEAEAAAKLPVADVAIGHRSATVCHLGNLAVRTGAYDHLGPRRRGRGDDGAAGPLVREARSVAREDAAMMHRRQFVRTALAAGGASSLALVTQAQPPAPADADPIPAEAQQVIDRSLAMLAATQSADGSFPDSRTNFGNVAITGLAGLALMAAGHQPGRGRFGEAVARAADYVVRRGNSNPSTPGYLNNADTQMSHGSMYQHGFGALFLAEVYGMVPGPDKQRALRAMLEKAVGLTRNSQNPEGGWRYEPRPVQVADISVTVAQLMALRAAKNAGVAVPKSVVDKCVAYIKSCQLPDGGFCYIKNQGGVGGAFARTAAAVVGLFSAGVYDGKAVDGGLAYLMRFVPGRRVNFAEARPDHYFYGHYYAALAMWTAGGNYWAEWFPAIRDELLARHRQTNGWVDWHGPGYAAAMACIILQLPNNYLPIMQK